MENIPVSTKTIIATSNLQFDTIKIFEKLEFSNSGDTSDIEIKVLYYQNQVRGDGSLLKKKPKKCFRNAVNVIMRIGSSKFINFKLSKNGKFQITGCKHEEHALQTVMFFIDTLFQQCPEAVLSSQQVLTVFFQTVMTNIDFSLGFCVNRSKLDQLLNHDTPYHSLLETSFGYTGVNIKFLVDSSWWKNEVPCVYRSVHQNEWTISRKPLEELQDLTDVYKNKKRYNTFLVFHSGNVIMSGIAKETMNDHYKIFRQMVTDWKPQIEECLTEK